MPQTATTEYNNRVWAGDPTTVAEARERFKQDPDGQLIPFAVALYSARKDRQFARELIELRGRLTARGRATLTELIPKEPRGKRELAERIDDLSTYMEWISRNMETLTPEKPLSFKLTLRDVALNLCERGIRLYDELWDDHTLLLIQLTMARIFLSAGYKGAALTRIRETADHATMSGVIQDDKQRVRIYARIGMLYRMAGERKTGFAWGIRALLVGSVPRNVRLKALAALLGYDR